MSRMLLATAVLASVLAGGSLGRAVAARAVPLPPVPAPAGALAEPEVAPGFELVLTLINSTGASADALVELWREDPTLFVRDGAPGNGRLTPSRVTWPRWTAPVADWSPWRVVVPGVVVPGADETHARVGFHGLPHDTPLWVEVRPLTPGAFERRIVACAAIARERGRHNVVVGLHTAGGVRAHFADANDTPVEAAWIARAGSRVAVAASADGALRLPLDAAGETEVELLAAEHGRLYRALRSVLVREGQWSDVGRVPLLALPPRFAGRALGPGTLRVFAEGTELAHLTEFGEGGAFALHGDWPDRLELVLEPEDALRFDAARVVLDSRTDPLAARSIELEPESRARPRVRVVARPFHARLGPLTGHLTWTLEREGQGAALVSRTHRLGLDSGERAVDGIDLGELEQGFWLLKLWDPARGLGAVRRFAVPPTDGGVRELGVELSDPGTRLRGVVRLEEHGQLRRDDLVFVGLRAEDGGFAQALAANRTSAFDSGYFELRGLVGGETYVLHFFDVRTGRLLATRAYDVPVHGELDVGTVRLTR